jgi:hypothetical protein
MNTVSTRLFCLTIFFCSFIEICSAQHERNFLQQAATKTILAQNLQKVIPSAETYSYYNRSFWNAIPSLYKNQIIAAGEDALHYKWQVVPAMTYLEFVLTGERYNMEDIYNENLTAIQKLLFAELIEGKKRFVPQLINGVWALCDISSWSISASLNLQKKGAGLPDPNEPIIELGAGITSNVMAWVYYLMKDNFDEYNPLISERLYNEIQRRILQPYYNRNDFWWMALDGKTRMVNNWNVWLNYNVLTCLLLVEKDTDKKTEGIYKTMRSVDQFINYYKEDGGCEEGPAYWTHAGGMLFNYLELLKEATGEKINLFDSVLVKRIGTYIAKAYIDGNYYLNYADASAKLTTDPALVYSYGKAISDSTLIRFGAYLAQQQRWKDSLPLSSVYGGLRNLQNISSILSTPPQAPYLSDIWMQETGIAIARDEAGTSEGFYFSALGGHNDESHNHNDVGTCVLYYDGQPILIDIGNETYTRKTFSNERYDIWTMRSLYHNVPHINDTEQAYGKKFKATSTSFRFNPKEAVFTTNIEKAYPENANIKSWQRSYHLRKKQSFTISDKYELSKMSGNTSLNFMTSAKVNKIDNGLLMFSINEVKLLVEYDPALLSVTVEAVPVADKKLLQSWPAEISRVSFKLLNTKKSGSHKIIFKKYK